MTIPKECRRIHASGARCHALAIKGTPFCYFHQAMRDFSQENRARKNSLLVPPPEDRASIQIGINSILDALGSSRMDPMRARVYLYGLQLSMQNLGRTGELVSRDSVHNPIALEDGQLLAPEDVAIEATPEPLQPINEQPQSPAISNVEQKLPPASVPPPNPEPPSESINISAVADTNTAIDINYASPSTVHSSPSTVHASPSMVHASPSTVHGSPSTVHASPSTVPASPLTPYGLLHAFQLENLELSEEEQRKRDYLVRMVEHTIRGILFATPNKDPNYRRKLRQQLRSELLYQHIPAKPEPRACAVTTRYRTVLLS